MLIPKINTQVWLSYMMKKTTITIQMKKKKGKGAGDRDWWKPQKKHPTGELGMGARFGGLALGHLASKLANVIRQGGRLKT